MAEEGKIPRGGWVEGKRVGMNVIIEDLEARHVSLESIFRVRFKDCVPPSRARQGEADEKALSLFRISIQVLIQLIDTYLALSPGKESLHNSSACVPAAYCSPECIVPNIRAPL